MTINYNFFVRIFVDMQYVDTSGYANNTTSVVILCNVCTTVAIEVPGGNRIRRINIRVSNYKGQLDMTRTT